MEAKRIRSRTTVVTALVALAMSGTFTASPGLGQMAGATAVDPAAVAALDQMSAYLRTLKAYQVEATTANEDVLENGLKAQAQGRTNFLVRMPDRLRITVSSDRQDRQYLYDGKQFTLFAERVGYYATVPAPATVRELADLALDKYGIEIPLADLFLWGTRETDRAAITAAVDLGPGTVLGVTCEHYAFRQEGLDWQIWIQRGDYPLPRRVVLTTTTDEARPQFEATYLWNLAPSFNDAAFSFDPPAGTYRITLTETAPAAGASN